MNFKALFLTIAALGLVQMVSAANPTAASQFQPYTPASIAAEKKMVFNIGYSRLDTSSYQGPAASGLAFEGQYAFTKKILATAGFFHYDYANAYSANSNFQMGAIGAELQPIQTDVLNGSEFFAAVTTGGAYIFNNDSTGINLYYGAGLGIKINADVGVRFDIKSGRNYITSNTISLVGYY